LASGGWGFRPQNPVLLLPPTNIALSVPVSGLENTAATNGQMLCFCFFRAFAPIFHFKLCNWWGRKNSFAPGRMVPLLRHCGRAPLPPRFSYMGQI